MDLDDISSLLDEKWLLFGLGFYAIIMVMVWMFTGKSFLMSWKIIISIAALPMCLGVLYGMGRNA